MMEHEHRRQAQVAATKSYFDELIDRHAESYLHAYEDVKEFSGFEKSGTGNNYIGMVWTNENEKPNAQVLKIRGSQSIANNQMLELDLSAVDSQQIFFPGQIVAFSADPYTKRQLRVKKFFDPMRISPKMKSIHTEDKINLLVASGPFMKPEVEDWTLFDTLVDSIKAQEASHVVLLGPFVDMENKAIRASYDINWRICRDKLVEGLVYHPCHVYLVPSNRDVLPAHPGSTYFYPSPKLEFDMKVKRSVVPKCTITFVTDPAQIDLGGVYLDVTSIEVLFHLNKCSTFINKGGNIFNPMYRSLIVQGMYPIYPPPIEVAIDYPKLRQHTQLDRLGAHVFVIPTRFSNGVTNVDNRLVVTIQKCSTRKQVILIEIPRIESSTEKPTDSIVISEYTHKLIDLLPKQEESGSQRPSELMDTSITSPPICS